MVFNPIIIIVYNSCLSKAIVRFTDSDYPFDIFKLFLLQLSIIIVVYDSCLSKAIVVTVYL